MRWRPTTTHRGLPTIPAVTRMMIRAIRVIKRLREITVPAVITTTKTNWRLNDTLRGLPTIPAVTCMMIRDMMIREIRVIERRRGMSTVPAVITTKTRWRQQTTTLRGLCCGLFLLNASRFAVPAVTRMMIRAIRVIKRLREITVPAVIITTKTNWRLNDTHRGLPTIPAVTCMMIRDMMIREIRVIERRRGMSTVPAVITTKINWRLNTTLRGLCCGLLLLNASRFAVHIGISLA
jgi:hypothetical protein